MFPTVILIMIMRQESLYVALQALFLKQIGVERELRRTDANAIVCRTAQGASAALIGVVEAAVPVQAGRYALPRDNAVHRIAQARDATKTTGVAGPVNALVRWSTARAWGNVSNCGCLSQAVRS